jgi:hypothetical protein
MEPERPIEKLLQAFAKKRREQTDDPPELHPATRRLLQNEVARRGRKRSEGGFFSRIAGGFRPGFVYGLCLLAVLGILSAMLLPALSRAKSKGTLASRGRAETRSVDSVQPARSYTAACDRA